MTRRRALIRSEAVDRLSAAGWRALREYGVRTIIDLREEDELSAAPGNGADARDGVETLHIPLDRIADDPEFWDDWMHGPQFGTPLYYAPFVERFPERIEQVLDAIEQATSSWPSAAPPPASWSPSSRNRSTSTGRPYTPGWLSSELQRYRQASVRYGRQGRAIFSSRLASGSFRSRYCVFTALRMP